MLSLQALFDRLENCPDFLKQNTLRLLDESGCFLPQFTYAEFLQNEIGLDVLWPYVDIESGLVVPEYIQGAAFDGDLVGLTYQDDAMPNGALAPFWDGVNDYSDLRSAAINAIFDGNELSVIIWAKMDDPLGADDEHIVNINQLTNSIWIYRESNPRSLRVRFVVGGVARTAVHTPYDDAAWHSIIFTRSLADDQLRLYVDGVEAGTSGLAGLVGTWPAGALDVFMVGAFNNAPQNPFDGWGGYLGFKFGNPVLTPAQALVIHNAMLTTLPD